jgi:hypothetical protein
MVDYNLDLYQVVKFWYWFQSHTTSAMDSSERSPSRQRHLSRTHTHTKDYCMNPSWQIVGHISSIIHQICMRYQTDLNPPMPLACTRTSFYHELLFSIQTSNTFPHHQPQFHPTIQSTPTQSTSLRPLFAAETGGGCGYLPHPLGRTSDKKLSSPKPFFKIVLYTFYIKKGGSLQYKAR